MEEEIMEEIWKDIVGYDGFYKVSSKGNVMNTGNYRDGRKYKPKVLTPNTDIHGYKYVNLYKNGKSKSIKIHRLVAEAFIRNPENKPCIDHINTDRSDNSVSNLRWVTYYENANNSITKKHLRDVWKGKEISDDFRRKRSEMMKANIEKVMEKVRIPVLQFTKDNIFVAEFPSTVDAAKAVKGNASSISRNCRGKRPTAYGYIWKYKNYGRIRN